MTQDENGTPHRYITRGGVTITRAEASRDYEGAVTPLQAELDRVGSTYTPAVKEITTSSSTAPQNTSEGDIMR